MCCRLYVSFNGGCDVRTELGGAAYEERREDRGSVHSGRSSATGLKGNDT